MQMSMGICGCTFVIVLKEKSGKYLSFLGIKILNFEFSITTVFSCVGFTFIVERDMDL